MSSHCHITHNSCSVYFAISGLESPPHPTPTCKAGDHTASSYLGSWQPPQPCWRAKGQEGTDSLTPTAPAAQGYMRGRDPIPRDPKACLDPGPLLSDPPVPCWTPGILRLTRCRLLLGALAGVGGVRPSAVLSLLGPQAAFLATALSHTTSCWQLLGPWPWPPR